MNHRWHTHKVVIVLFMAVCSCANADEVNLSRGLIGHWPLVKDANDVSGNGHDAQVNGVKWPKDDVGAAFDGREDTLDVATHPDLRFGREDFSVAAWIWTDGSTDDVPGDILSQYDATRRRGFHLGLKTNTGVTFNQSSYRQLQFGIDNNQRSDWRDCGHPGKNSILAFALTTHEGRLFAGTCEPDVGDSGHVYVYGGGDRWIDCGSPARSNAITAMAVFGGELYLGTGKYRVAGSALNESENINLGGRIFRYGGGTTWTDCGQLPDAEAVSGLVVFQGRFYAGSLYKPAGFFRYEGDARWTRLDVPDGKRVEALGVYNNHLYATSYDGGHVYRFDGKTWTDLGQLGDPAENTQTYSFAVYEGRLYVGTWRSGRVYRLEEPHPSSTSRKPSSDIQPNSVTNKSPLVTWQDVGRLGEELEVMGMLVHNGRLMAGTLPLAEVYQFNGGTTWEKLARLDLTPDVKYRRAWTMAEYQGQLFCSTLPNGRVQACEFGKLVTWDYEFPTGWHHVAGVKSGGKLLLYVDGKLKSSSTDFNPDDFDLSNEQTLRIGSGPNDFFNGRIRDVRLYRRALAQTEVATLSNTK